MNEDALVRIKEGVSLDRTHPKLWFAIAMAARVWGQFGLAELWITGAHEPGHTTNPDTHRQFHLLPDGTCQASDLGVHKFKNDEQKREAQRILSSILGKYYDVLLEKLGTPQEHMHVQYDPERPGTIA